MNRINRILTCTTLAVLLALAAGTPARASMSFHDWTSVSSSGVWTYSNTSSAGTITGTSSRFAPATSNFTLPIAPQHIFTSEFNTFGTVGDSITFVFANGLGNYAWGTGGQLILGNIHNYYQYTLSAWDFNGNPIDVNQFLTLPPEFPLGTTCKTDRYPAGYSSVFEVFDPSCDTGSGQGGVLVLAGIKNVGKVQLMMTDSGLDPAHSGSDFIIFNFATPDPEVCCGRKPYYRGVGFQKLQGQIAVATQWPKGGAWPLANQSLVIWNISNPPAPYQDWAPTDSYYSDPSWNGANLGDVFGLTLDDTGNIFVTATTIYGAAPNIAGPGRIGYLANPQTMYQTGEHGQIYKIENLTGTPTPFVQLPNPHGAGLGNITYDCEHKSFYVSNFDDGLIYRVDASGKLSAKQKSWPTWDHGSNLVSFTNLSGNNVGRPAIIGQDSQNYFAKLGRRPWAVRVHEGRLYYSIWGMDMGHPSTQVFDRNEIWSVALDSAGNFAGVARLEISLPLLAAVDPFRYSNPVSDLTFTATGNMIIAERTMLDGNISSRFSSRVLEYSFSSNIWTPANQVKYQVGCVFTGSIGYPANSAGGVDLDQTPNATYRVWATGDWLHLPGRTPPYLDFVSGLQGFRPTGGNVVSSILIDLDLKSLTYPDLETQPGDVRIPCAVAGPAAQPPSVPE